MKKNSKDVILSAAVSLFNRKGYSGTPIREIAKVAKVNQANINYHFDSKLGLLEYCFTVFFETYMEELDKGFSLLELGATPTECLKGITENLLNYQFNHFDLTRLVLREMSIDSQVVREILSTYYKKEWYLFRTVLEEGMETKEFSEHSIEYLIMQYKGLLATPFISKQYLTEVLHVPLQGRFFAERYTQEIIQWIDRVVCNPQYKELKPITT
jgi:AcrR family transcriptional regulator